MKGLKTLYSPEVISRRVRQLGREISRDFRGKTVDLVAVLDNGYVFVADLARALDVPVRTHFIRTEVRDIVDPNTGKPRQEIFYTPEVEADGKNIVLVDGLVQTGITHDFLLRRISLRNPRSVKTAVLIDKVMDRRVLLEPDYVGFRLASNDVVIGYGLAWNGLHGNLPYVGKINRSAAGSAGRNKKGKK
ncbi:MAG: phosphoribosyltransferase [Candidatus Acidiferrales bacterium]